ncbi:hypothetical protein Pmani_038632 [Petrolisthes manimaculis]|uniref:Uncharacterized protein n=1 Tax=Petrolisthes manimaculis TaxID=1843537 RepID=A0AAE1TM38_9EUCA|nr:hypothetical protein Pmani_038632 [Petrolisthes manimaculis]
MGQTVHQDKWDKQYNRIDGTYYNITDGTNRTPGLEGEGEWGSSSRTLKMDEGCVCVVVCGVAEDSNVARWDTNHLFCMLASPLPRTT